MYVASCMFETMPDDMYMLHAKNIVTEPAQSEGALLDAPIYTPTKFCSTSQARWDGTTLRILELTRQATSAFFTLHDMRESDNASHSNDALADLTFCHHALLAFPGITDRPTQEQGLSEVVRMSCCIFVHALVLRVPLSQAVKDASLQMTKPAISQTSRESMLLQLKEALKSSRFGDCWDDKSSVLLWCGLVALASFNSNPIGEQELQKARDFIAAVTLRTAILQVFGRPVAMLGMLKRFVLIQHVLARGVRHCGQRQLTSHASKGKDRSGAEARQMKILDTS